ncbi:MAG: Uma2 family endonuclease [Lachnospiraceae bacterium]
MDELSFNIKDVINADNHLELINGVTIVEDTTTPYHNIAVTEIATALKNHIASNNGECTVFTENVGLFVNEMCNSDKNFFMPDVMVVCNKKGIQKDGVHSVPKFVVEVTSESTRKYDYWEKLEIYRKIGVDEYWIVDLQKNVIVKYLKEEDYIQQYFFHPKELEVSTYGLTINVSTFII